MGLQVLDMLVLVLVNLAGRGIGLAGLMLTGLARFVEFAGFTGIVSV